MNFSDETDLVFKQPRPNKHLNYQNMCLRLETINRNFVMNKRGTPWETTALMSQRNNLLSTDLRNFLVMFILL